MGVKRTFSTIMTSDNDGICKSHGVRGFVVVVGRPYALTAHTIPSRLIVVLDYDWGSGGQCVNRHGIGFTDLRIQ